MKKTTILLALLVACFAASNAQEAYTPSWSAGFDLRGALPMGDFKDITDFGVGGTGFVSYSVSPQVAITGRAGYLYFGGKELSYSDGVNSGTIKTKYGMIPFLAGAKIFFSEGESRVYVAGEAGLYILSATVDISISGGGSSLSGSGSDTQSKFGVSPSLGAQFKAGDNMMVDAHANFSNVFADGTSFNWVTFAVGFEWMMN
jgi:opacity protein-like surface antigen